MIKFEVRREDGTTYEARVPEKRVAEFRAHLNRVGHVAVRQESDDPEMLRREQKLDRLIELLPDIELLLANLPA